MLHFQDISKDGEVSINSDTQRDQQVFADTQSGQVRDFSFFPFENLAAISRDSRMFLLNAYVTGPNSDYNLYTQATDGSSPALIGQGAGLALSFDGKWALALDPIHLDHLRIIPTGVGESSSLSAPPGLNYSIGTWMPDGKQILVVASGAGHTPVTYLQDIASGAAHQITHEGHYAVFFNDCRGERLTRWPIFPDHRWRKSLLDTTDRWRRAEGNPRPGRRRFPPGVA